MDQTAKIRKAILDFPWDDFGLNEVTTANPGYAKALSEHIIQELTASTSENQEQSRGEGGSK